MRKIPTLFERDWDGDRSRVVDKVHPGCEWVLAGEGIATRKLDGTCCLISDGRLFKRREIKNDAVRPSDFVLVDEDTETGKVVGWVPVTDDPADRWYREAFKAGGELAEGTYELIGPKVQGNPEHWPAHQLIRHGYSSSPVPNIERRTFEGIREWLTGQDIEGIVFHHPDGRMAKIKLRDFGLKRGAA